MKTLSDKIEDNPEDIMLDYDLDFKYKQFICVEDVKQFIKDLKEELLDSLWFDGTQERNRLIELIDKLAGEKLVEKEE